MGEEFDMWSAEFIIWVFCHNVLFPIRCGIALDTWMFPLDEKIFPQVKQPIFFINSERFQWAANISKMLKLDSAVVQRKMITIRCDGQVQTLPFKKLFVPS